MIDTGLTGSEDSERADSLPAELSEPVTPGVSNTPGSVLRRTREAHGHSIADVVQVIRFSARQIEAVERDDYASLPGSIAVRGLVRNYAKFLRLDAAPLLEQLDPAVPLPEADVRPPANMGVAEQPTIVERVPPKYVAAVALVLVLGLAGYGYMNFYAGVDGRLGDLIGRADTQPDAVITNPSVVSPVDPAADSRIDLPSGAAPAGVAESADAANAASTALPFAGLRVEFDELSWIEVRDAAQKIVFVGEYPAGTRQNIEGKPPFQVWIGKASGVRVYMGERSIDLKPYTREEVARFTLE
ncbi:MAG: helix-turn-helix domain-containing protein [Burkholderiaceae bacterium]|nr:helix-turn-helix domain-containing protein [Burkholderiaceae bacterium]MCF8183908.1 helix-turn-helix domain-containing protein [Polynucleobacter sp.]